MSFEKFEKMSVRTGRKPAVSVMRGGRLALNGGCLAAFMPGATHVHLYFDAKEKRIGLKPLSAKEKDADAFSLIGTRRSRARFVQAVGFLRHHGAIPEKTLRFEPYRDEKSGLVVVDLRKPLA